MTLLHPIFSEIPKIHKQRIPSLSQDLKHPRINKFQSQPQTIKLLQIPIPKHQPRHSFLQCHKSHLILHNIIKGGCSWIFQVLHHFHYRNPSPRLATKARGLQGCGPRRTSGSHITCSRECKECEGMNPHTPKWTLVLGVGVPNGLLNFLHDCKGQNSLPRSVLYIIEKLLKCRRLKWARIAHLDIWNTSYGQKKGRESNWQFDSRPLEIGNRPNFLAFRQRVT
jgi:hypothetical protein